VRDPAAAQLLDAASAGDLPLMRVLIARFGADVFVADPANGVTLLHTGAKSVLIHFITHSSVL
jgi:hypothetical protein